jgi:hypothetical protein
MRGAFGITLDIASDKQTVEGHKGADPSPFRPGQEGNVTRPPITVRTQPRRRGRRWQGVRRSVAALSLLAVLSGCARLADPGNGAATPALPADPVLAFAATAAPGMSQIVYDPVLGPGITVRVSRAYEAASGRLCKELLTTSSGGAQQVRLACGDGDSWGYARPLRAYGALAGLTPAAGQ